MALDYATPAAPVSKAGKIVGWILTILPAPLFVMSAVMKFTKPDAAVKGMNDLGWPQHLATPLGFVELGCLLIYLIPQTAVLGAILLTGYLGGAVASHLRAGQPFFMPAVIGVILWLGLYLRDPRIRALAPLRR